MLADVPRFAASMVVLALFTPLGASAQDALGAGADGADQAETPARQPGSPEDVEATQSASEHFRAGMQHFQERAFREAIREFEIAAGLVPSADLWFNIARAHEELSEYERAVEHYRRYLRDRVDPPDRAQIEAHIEALEERAEAARLARRTSPTTGTLRVRTSEAGAAIRVADDQVGSAPVEMPLSLEPGRHRLDIEQPGFVPFRSEVRIEAGVTTGAYAELVPATEYRAIRGRRIWTWVVGGLAVAGAATAVGLGARAQALQNDEDFAGARDWAAYSDYTLGTSIVLAVGALVLFFVEGRSVGTERVAPDVASAE